MFKMTLFQERLVSSFRKIAFIVQDMDYTHGFLSNQVDGGLIVVIGDVRPVDSFLSIFLLLDGEYVLVEIELQCLVRIVDAQLLKAVDLEVLQNYNYSS